MQTILTESTETKVDTRGKMGFSIINSKRKCMVGKNDFTKDWRTGSKVLRFKGGKCPATNNKVHTKIVERCVLSCDNFSH